MSVIARRGGKNIPLAFSAIRTPLLGFADHEDGKAVIAHVDGLRFLIRERSDIWMVSGAQLISRLEEMGRGDHISHECSSSLLVGPGFGVCFGFKVCNG